MVENSGGRPSMDRSEKGEGKKTRRGHVVFIGFDETEVYAEFGEAGGFNTLDTLVDYNCEELKHQERERYGRIQGEDAPGVRFEDRIRIAHGLHESGNGNGTNGNKNGNISPGEYERHLNRLDEINEKKYKE